MIPVTNNPVTRQANRNHYPALDGLRGIAILLVILHHNFRFSDYFFFGWLGVDLFFVLSGFLITDILLNSLGKPNFLRNFYLRRVLRIFPVFYLSLIICLLIVPNINSIRTNTTYYTENQIWLWAYLQNWLFTLKEPYGDPILLHTWSLAVEEQFYLVWPLIIMLFRKPKLLLFLALTMLVLMVVSRYVVWSMQIKGLAYYNLFTFTRVDGLCIGSALALLLRNNAAFLKSFILFIVLFVAGVNFGFYFINRQYNFSLPYLAFAGYTTFAVLFGILVHEAVTGKSPVIQFLFNNRPLKFFGKISYGLYVWHWPIYILLFNDTRVFFIKRFSTSSTIADVSSGVFVTALAVVISVISYRYFERPFLKLKARYS